MSSYNKSKIPLVRRVFPELMANKLVGVQPMTGPVGLAYALRFNVNILNDIYKFLEEHPDFTGCIWNESTRVHLKYGKIHREDGPAIDYMENGERNEWWFEGEYYSEENWKQIIRSKKLESFFDERDV